MLHCPPFTVSDLHHAEFINIDLEGAFKKGVSAMGIDVTDNTYPVLTESYTVMWELTKQGVGIGILDANIGDAEPMVARVLPDMPPLMFPIWLLAHRDLNASRRIRRVFDFLATELA